MKVKDLVQELIKRDQNKDLFIFWNAPDYYGGVVELKVDAIFTNPEGEEEGEEDVVLNCSER